MLDWTQHEQGILHVKSQAFFPTGRGNAVDGIIGSIAFINLNQIQGFDISRQGRLGNDDAIGFKALLEFLLGTNFLF